MLVAEDNEQSRRLLEFLLEGLGIRADFVGDGLAAVEKWASGDYRVVLMDRQMPGCDGLTATRRIRLEEERRGTPARGRTCIVGVTANALPGDLTDCAAAGMDDVICKPIALEKLEEVLWRAMSLQDGSRSSSGREGAGPENNPMIARLFAELDADSVRALVGEFELEMRACRERLAAWNDEGGLARIQNATRRWSDAAAMLGYEGLAAEFHTLSRMAGAGDRGACVVAIGSLADSLDAVLGSLRTWRAGGRQGD